MDRFVFCFLDYIYPQTAYSIRSYLTIPGSVLEWIQNILIIGLGSTFGVEKANVRMLPPSWALHIELLFFLILPLIARSKKGTITWVLVSVIFTICSIYVQQPFQYRYLPVQAASLPYSLGAVLYFFRKDIDSITVKLKMNLLTIMIILLIINLFFSSFILNAQGPPFYINLLLNIGTIAFLGSIASERIPKKVLLIDKLLGDLSFPIFLIHWPVAVLISVVIFNGKAPVGLYGQLKLYGFSLPAINILAVLICITFERRIQELRKKIKQAIINDREGVRQM